MPNRPTQAYAESQARGPGAVPDLVKDQAELEGLLGEMRRAGRFAFDTEFVMEESFRSHICLIQVATDAGVSLIDPLTGLDDIPFWNLVSDPSIEKIVHAGAEDVALCVQRTGQVPRNVFDVQIAAGLVGLDYPLSLLKLVRATVGARLHKSQTLTDWRRRPLTAAQLQYAREDVAYLPQVHDYILKRLKKLSRLEWAREEFEKFERPETYARAEAEQLLRLKGARTLSPRGLAIARELMKVREGLAERFNRPPRVLLKDHLLVEIARNEWATVKDIRGLRGVQLSTTAVRDMAEAVQRGAASPPETWPQPPESELETPEEPALVALVTAAVRAYCHEHEIAYGLVASKQAARDLVSTFIREGERKDSPLSRGWRSRSIGKVLHELFAGKRKLGIARDRDVFKVVVE